mmetsp:Transcript_815/g.1948  ORF Transcript_815/g.1948 Transcript_815/m.1948 type:complete len:164 (+) Transcript_815:365-856(+)
MDSPVLCCCCRFITYVVSLFLLVCSQTIRGLQSVLETGNLTTYPALCVNVTASFAVLSDTINAIRSILEQKRNRTDLAEHIRTLQKYEQEKLNLTAALHLEQMRKQNETAMQRNKDNDDKRVSYLLSESVESLSSQVAKCVESINEVLEEIRCVRMEEMMQEE